MCCMQAITSPMIVTVSSVGVIVPYYLSCIPPRHLKATEPGASLVLSVVITHPTLGQYFDAHLIAHKCEHGTHDRNEHAGLMTLLR